MNTKSYLAALAFLLAPPSTAKSEPNKELLETLIANNTAVQAKYKSFTCVQEWDTVQPYLGEPREGLPDEDILCHYEMTITRDADHFLLNRSESLASRSKGWEEQRRLQCVRNNEYSAIYLEQPTNTMYLHRHGQGMERSEAGVVGMAQPCAVDYLFGYGPHALHEDYASSKDRAEWAAEHTERDGETLYLISKTVTAKNGRSRKVCCYLNPEKDFLLQGFEAYDREGNLANEVKIELVRSNDLWIPKTILVTEFTEEQIALTMKVKEFRIEPKLKDDFFSYHAFRVLDGANMIMNIDEKSSVQYTFTGKEWKEL